VIVRLFADELLLELEELLDRDELLLDELLLDREELLLGQGAEAALGVQGAVRQQQGCAH
jgi:hypothetical protein